MACRYTYQGKTYSAQDFDDVLRAMAPEIAAKYMPGVSSTPTAPFVTDTKSWTSLALKRAIAYAVDNGFDKIAWTTGAQQADRYALSKQISSLRYNKTGNGYGVVAIGEGAGIVLERTVSEADLPSVVGKDLARKIIAGEGTPTKTELNNGDVIDTKSFSGLDTKVGGEGMHAYYDEILPQVARKLGVKIEEVDLREKLDPRRAMARRLIGEVQRDAGKSNRAFPELQPGFTLTPEIKAQVEVKGLPLFSRKRIIGDSGRQHTPEQRALFQHVGREVDSLTTLERLKKMASQKWVQGLFDQFRPVRDLTLKGYTLMRLSKGANGAFEALMHHGKLKLRDGTYDADMSGGVLDKVFYPLGKETTDFLYWIAGNRAERLAAEGKERLFSPADIAAAKSIATGTTDFDYTLSNGTVTRERALIYNDSLRKFNEFSKNVLDMAEQSDLIDGNSRSLWEHEFYVPFYRVMDDTDGGVRGMNIKKGVVRQEAFKKLKGGEEQLGDLLANTLMNWAHLLDAAAKNRAAKQVLDTATAMGIARPAAAGEKHTVWYSDKGRKAEFVVDSPELLVALQGLDYVGIRGPMMSILSKPKHWLTIGVTASPFFKLRNLIRDSIQSIATSELSGNIASNLIHGVQLTAKDRQEYVSALAGGGLIRFGTMLEGNEAARVRQLIKNGAKDAHILDNESKLRAFYDATLEPLLSWYNELGNRGEEINRMALYDQLIRQGKDHATASLMARDLMDFSSQGAFASTRFLAQIVPFFNARLQGAYKLGRSATGTPQEKAKLAVTTATVALAGLALLGYAASDDDRWKRWKRREQFDIDNYWLFTIGGMDYRIPKPFELGAVATMFERLTQTAFLDNEKEKWQVFGKALLKIASDQMSMNPTPQAFKPILEIYANKDSFSQRPIETTSMEKLDPMYRYSAGTTMLARYGSRAAQGLLSPVQIDHLARGYFGWLGSTAMASADIVLRRAAGEPTRPVLDHWKVATGGMVASSDSAGSRYVSMMYDQAKELEQAHGTFRQLRKEGKTEEAKAYRDSHKEELQRYKQVEGIKKAISKMNEKIRIIERSALDPHVKRDRIIELKKKESDLAARLVPLE